ncbi:TPA: Kae1-associated serine/threonine protein kinase [archaeon]|nr:Kae1-associated serine/threonine protein kinase [Candidatus Naiadarchaeales archaeon SRR2090153.bin461]HIK02389.1 Kae1-associated serine/threonine protein kinase [Candidatus Naiadarchaeales archaeon SRR2090159.bin1288]
MSKELKLGAEARITLRDKVVIKERIKKSYRLPQIDSVLRRERTSAEAGLLQKAARAQASVPRVLKVDKENNTIEMEFIEGTLIDKVIDEKLAKELGKEIAVLHDNSIIHGDLTTSNIIVRDSKIYFIDFGLGEFSDSAESKAMDLHLLKEAIEANHPEKANNLNKAIIDSYRQNSKRANEVLERLAGIEKRGRYKNRLG